MPRKNQTPDVLNVSELIKLIQAKTTPEVMNLVEFMEYTRLGYQTAQEILKEIPHRHLHREWRIHKQAVDNWLMNKNEDTPA